MRGRAALWIALIASCAHAPRPTARSAKPAHARSSATPAAPPATITPSSAGAWNPPPPPAPRLHTLAALPANLYLLEPPAWMGKLDELPDDVSLVHAYPSSRVTLPPAQTPIIPRAPRPFLGEALSLADRALARGDPFDAAAQYRQLLASASSEDTPYLELQLSRAYVALGDLDEAEAILRKRVDVDTDAAWPAVYELAALRVRHRAADPYETWLWLAPAVGPLRGDLARYLRWLDPSADGLAYVEAVELPPPSSLVVACESALAAFHAQPSNDLPSWDVCPSPPTPLFPADRTSSEEIQLQRIAWRVRTWSARTTPGDEERWLIVAKEEADTADLAPTSPGAKIASWLALLAYRNAATIAELHGRSYTGTAFSYADVRFNIDRLSSSMRDPARRAVDSFMRVTR